MSFVKKKKEEEEEEGKEEREKWKTKNQYSENEHTTAGSRSSARGKGGIERQESPWKFSSIYPQNQSLFTFCFVLSPTPLTLRGAVPHYLSLKKRVNLQLQLIKFLGVIVFQPTNSFGSPLLLLLLSRFSRVRLCATPKMAAHQAPLSLGFSRQEYWSGLPSPSPMHESEK